MIDYRDWTVSGSSLVAVLHPNTEVWEIEMQAAMPVFVRAPEIQTQNPKLVQQALYPLSRISSFSWEFKNYCINLDQ